MGLLGAQNNLLGLPSHYTLPSGDKIPQLRLVLVNKAIRSGGVFLIVFRAGVWQARKGAAEYAVQVLVDVRLGLHR